MKKRLNAHLYVTPKCNFKCKHCYSSENQNLEDRLLEISELVDITKKLVENYDVYIDVEGGELFLKEDIREYFMQLDKKELERITVTTNGSIPYDIPSKYLKELDEFRVSLEGHTDELNMVIRGMPIQPIIDNCIKWLNAGVSVVLRLTLNKMNYMYIPEIIKKYSNIGFKRFSFYEYQSVGRGKLNEEDFLLSVEQIDKTIDLIATEAKKYKGLEYVKLSLSKNRDNLITKYEENNKFKIDYLGNIASVFINHNGQLGICPWHVNDGNHYNLEYSKENFIENIDYLINKNESDHNCSNCTTKRILF